MSNVTSTVCWGCKILVPSLTSKYDYAMNSSAFFFFSFLFWLCYLPSSLIKLYPADTLVKQSALLCLTIAFTVSVYSHFHIRALKKMFQSTVYNCFVHWLA